MSDPRLPVEVDAWSDGRWSRVEREMFERLDAPDRADAERERRRVLRRRVALAGGLAAAAAVGIFALVRPAGVLHSSDRLRVATTDSMSEVTVGESSLTVSPRSLVMVSGDDEHGVDVLLDRGSVTCEVAPRRGRPAFVVDAGEVRVRVVGTRFTVTRDAFATSVAVDHGVVEVSVSGRVTVMHDGERWREPGVPSVTSEPSPPQSLPPAVVPSAPPLSTATARAATSVSAVGPPRGRIPAAQASSPLPSPVRSGSQTADSPPESASTMAPAPAAASQPSVQEAYESAARIEKTRPDDAAAIYRRLAVGTTAWAQSALFALARLEADRGHRSEATGLLDDYLARYPHGINADDARALLQRMR